jgi:RNA polymerase sigma-70 factor (ECF subfamily)
VADRRRTHSLASLADEDLLAQVGRADDEAFAVLYDRHARVAYSLAYRLLGSRESAEDLVQDVFLAVWRGSQSYSPLRGSVRTWLLSIVHHRGVDRLRTSSAMARRQEALVREEAGRIEPDAAEAAIGAVEAESVRRALADLPAEQLDVVRLAYFGGFTHQEIAEALEVPLGTVKSRMRLALERIRRSMDPGGTGLSPA